MLGSNKLRIQVRIQEAQKHTDVDPDPEHSRKYIRFRS